MTPNPFEFPVHHPPENVRYWSPKFVSAMEFCSTVFSPRTTSVSSPNQILTIHVLHIYWEIVFTHFLS